MKPWQKQWHAIIITASVSEEIINKNMQNLEYVFAFAFVVVIRILVFHCAEKPAASLLPSSIFCKRVRVLFL